MYQIITKILNRAILIIILTLILPTACNSQESSQEEEARNLERLFLKIKNLADAYRCENSSEWTFIDYGSKACGGPQGYIAYSNSSDTTLILESIEQHKTAEKEYNNKWGIISDCSLPQQPTAIICESGEPVFTY